MSKVVVSHAIEVGPESIWYPQLSDDLVADGHQVDIVRFPDPQAPDADTWLETLTEATAAASPTDTVLVGHSLGGVNTLRLLQRHDVERNGPFAAVVLVATMAHSVGYDALAAFFEPAFDWATIRRAAREFRVLIAADDPVLTPDPIEHLTQFVTGLSATGIVKPTGGHFPIWSPEAPPHLPRLPEVTRLVLDGLATRD
jgi:predicted alpha/beta hydrolase family esterase